MIWIILGLLPLVLFFIAVCVDEPMAGFIVLAALGVIGLMATSITYGLYQIGVVP